MENVYSVLPWAYVLSESKRDLTNKPAEILNKKNM